MPCLAANPHLFGHCSGWLLRWQSSNPTCGYPAVHGFLGERLNIAFMGNTSFCSQYFGAALRTRAWRTSGNVHTSGSKLVLLSFQPNAFLTGWCEAQRNTSLVQKKVRD
jgi:hypothetical protein